ncbi:MAG: hypothetical protein MUF68_07315 [Cyclobacteriaceae bacterium]|jgi:hypothetical protein|nr:hypothetical protein [Cyclobacteriaceae bacterium]
MSSAELKSNLHKLIDNVNNEELLLALYEFINQEEKEEDSKFWNSLTTEQKEKVYQSFEESNHDDKLLSWDSVKRKFE